MKTTLRKTMSILLVVFMIATMVPMTFFSANAAEASAFQTVAHYTFVDGVKTDINNANELSYQQWGESSTGNDYFKIGDGGLYGTINSVSGDNWSATLKFRYDTNIYSGNESKGSVIELGTSSSDVSVRVSYDGYLYVNGSQVGKVIDGSQFDKSKNHVLNLDYSGGVVKCYVNYSLKQSASLSARTINTLRIGLNAAKDSGFKDMYVFDFLLTKKTVSTISSGTAAYGTVDTTLPTISTYHATFTDDGDFYSDSDYAKIYANLLYAEQNVGSGCEKAKLSDHYFVSGDTGFRADQVIYYPTVVMVYDGITTPKFGVMFMMNGTTKPGTWNYNNLRVFAVGFAADQNGLVFNSGNWRGQDSKFNNQWNWISTSDNGRKDYNNSVTVTDQSSAYCNGMDDKFLSNIISFIPDSFDEGYRSITPTFFIRGGWDKKNGVNNVTATSPVYVLNYKKVIDKVNTEKSFLSTFTKENYTIASVNAYFDAVTALAKFNPNNYNYAGETASAVQSAANDISTLISAVDTAKANLVPLYTVTFVDAAGNAVKSERLERGTVPTVPTTNSQMVNKDDTYHTVYSWPAVSALNADTVYNEIATDVAHTIVVTGVDKTVTCTENGSVAERKCSVCNTVITEGQTITAAGHSFVTYVNNNDANCTTDGTETATCENCSVTDTRVITGSKLGHNYTGAIRSNNDGTHSFLCKNGCGTYGDLTNCTYTSQQKKAPTCTAKGTTTYTCMACDYSYDSDDLDILGHTKGAAVESDRVEATCTKDGSYKLTVRCTVCNLILSEETKTIPATGHNLVAHEAMSPTCDNAGYKAYNTCSRCDYTTKEEVPALGHNFDDTIAANVVTVVANCHEAGSKTVKCSRCDKTEVSTTAIDLTNHDGDEELRNRVTATCAQNGYTGDTYCTGCNTKLSEGSVIYKDSIAHSYGGWVVAFASTCSTMGTEKRTCSVCGDVDINALDYNSANHESVVTDDAVEATCSETGLTEGSHCSRCNAVIVERQTVPMKDHTPSAAVRENEVAPSCITAGSYDEVVRCSVCNAIISSETKSVDLSDHSYGEWTTDVASTCKVQGSEKRVCSVCKAEETRALALDASNHANIVDDAAVAATCSETGLTAGKHCADCDTVTVAQTATAALGHDYIDHDAKAPTCTENGWAAYQTCSRCEYTTKTEIPASHTPAAAVQEDVVNATCTVEGSYKSVVYCYVCGEKLSIEDKVIEKAAHTYVDATCDQPATCSVCGYSSGAAIGHAWNDGVVTTPATCENAGEKTYTCTRDASHTRTEVINALGHTYVDHVAKAATCTEIGWDAYQTCENCTYSTYSGIKALGHAYEATVTAPTCSAQGYTTHTCARCQDAYVDTYTAALIHTGGTANCVDKAICDLCGEAYGEVDPANHKSVVTDSAKAATCSETGLTEGSHCEACGNVITAQTVVDKAAHTPAAAVQENEVPATCKAAGSYDEVVKCSVCGDTLSTTAKTIEKLAHTEETITGTAATCKATGLTDGVKCSVCGEILTQQEEIAKLAHTPAAAVQENVVPATCKAAGSYDEVVKCSVCGDTLSTTAKTIEKLAHTEETITGTAATCKATGLTDGVKCSVCGEILTQQEVIAKLDHTPETTPGKAATCTEAGYTDKVTCSVCGTVITASTVIAAKGHKFGEWVTVSETETLVKLQRTCSVCGAKETMEYSKEEVPKRSIRFNAMSNMHYVVNESLVIYNTTTAKAPVNVDVKFRVTTYSSFSSDGYIIYIDGVEAQPDADGYYTIPAGEDSVSVSISRAIEDTDNGSGSGSGTSTGKLSFWEWLLRLIRKILSVFKK